MLIAKDSVFIPAYLINDPRVSLRTRLLLAIATLGWDMAGPASGTAPASMAHYTVIAPVKDIARAVGVSEKLLWMVNKELDVMVENGMLLRDTVGGLTGYRLAMENHPKLQGRQHAAERFFNEELATPTRRSIRDNPKLRKSMHMDQRHGTVLMDLRPRDVRRQAEPTDDTGCTGCVFMKFGGDTRLDDDLVPSNVIPFPRASSGR